MERFFHAVLVGDTGPVTSSDDWPQPLAELIGESDGVEIDESTIRVHCLCRGFDPEYVWRMDAARGMLEHLSDRWQLTQVDGLRWPVLNGRSQLSGEPTPTWWSPQRDADTSFYVCRHTLAGDEGDLFQVALDKKRNTIFVHYWFHF